MSEEPRKRSRFDQTDPEPPRRSRFDRRSRSPSNKDSETRRSRSPLARNSGSPAVTENKDPAAAAAAAAARINAQIQARKGVQHVDVPPIRASGSPAGAQSPSIGANGLNAEIYTQDGDFIRDIEVNDLRNRYTLTKGSTQKMIKEKTGADVTTRGNYYPDKSMATAANPPLYLHVTSTSREGLEKAVAEIEEMMKQELPNLIDERRFRRREPEQVERDSLGRRKWPEEKIPVDLEPIPGFNLRAQVVGQGGSYVKHIQQETRCRVQIKGRGSGFMEHDTGRESDEQMYLHVAGPDPNEVTRAKDLCLDLLGNVRTQYEAFKERGPRGGGGGGGDFGDRGYRGGGGGGGYQDRERNSSYGGGNSNYGGGNSSYGGGGYGGGSAGGYGGYNSPATAMTPATGAAMSPVAGQQAAAPDYATAQAYAQYYQQNPGQDPYAAYGGYEAYTKAYYEYYAQQTATQQPAGTPQNGEQPPPPPAEDAAPPPPSDNAPPPPPGSSGGYNAVPPPPGM